MTGANHNDPFDTGFEAEDEFAPSAAADGWTSPAAAAGLAFDASALGGDPFEPSAGAPPYDPFAEQVSSAGRRAPFEDDDGYSSALLRAGELEAADHAPAGGYAASPNPVADMQADIEASLGHAGKLRLHADLFGQTSFHLTSLGDTFNPGDTVPGYTLVNLRADWVDPFGSDGITASVFVKNVTDTYYFTGGGGGVQANGTNSLNLGMPRTWGVQLKAAF